MENNTCANCGAPLTGPYCSQCGQRDVPRITVRRLFIQLWEALTDVDRGAWYTLWALMTRPGQAIRAYLDGKTRPFTPPIRYALVLTSIFVLLQLYFGIYEDQQALLGDRLTPNDEARDAYMDNQRALIENAGPFFQFIPLILVPFYALSFHGLYRKKERLNIAEHAVVCTFCIGQTALFSMILLPLPIFFGLSGIGLLSSFLITIFYFSWVYRNLMQVSWLRAIVSGLIGLLLGYIMLIIIVAVVTVLVLLIMAGLGLLEA